MMNTPPSPSHGKSPSRNAWADRHWDEWPPHPRLRGRTGRYRSRHEAPSSPAQPRAPLTWSPGATFWHTHPRPIPSWRNGLSDLFRDHHGRKTRRPTSPRCSRKGGSEVRIDPRSRVPTLCKSPPQMALPLHRGSGRASISFDDTGIWSTQVGRCCRATDARTLGNLREIAPELAGVGRRSHAVRSARIRPSSAPVHGRGTSMTSFYVARPQNAGLGHVNDRLPATCSGHSFAERPADRPRGARNDRRAITFRDNPTQTRGYGEHEFPTRRGEVACDGRRSRSTTPACTDAEAPRAPRRRRKDARGRA
jgi:hypothetical protein